MTNFPCKKRVVSVNEKEVVLYDLTIGILMDIEAGNTDDSFINVLKDASSMDDETIKHLRRSQASALVKEIMDLTYGSRDDNETTEEKEGDKKK